MTIGEFLVKLKETNRDNWVWHCGRIRFRNQAGKMCCPIDALGGDWAKYDGGLGLGNADVCAIVAAADDFGPDQLLRQKIKEAVGL